MQTAAYWAAAPQLGHASSACGLWLQGAYLMSGAVLHMYESAACSYTSLHEVSAVQLECL